MAVVLYRKGDKEVINGIPCESAKFEPTSMKNALAAGWYLSPEEAQAGKKKGIEPSEVKDEPIPVQTPLEKRVQARMEAKGAAAADKPQAFKSIKDSLKGLLKSDK